MKTLKPLGVFYVDGRGRVEILEIVHGIEDEVKCCMVNDGMRVTAKCRIHYDENGDPYFRTYGTNIYFKDVMRV